MSAKRAPAIVLILAAAAACSRAPEGALPDLSDAPVLATVVRRDMPERVPAYGIVTRGATGEQLEVTVEAQDGRRVRAGQTADAFVLPSTNPVHCRVLRVMRGASTETGQAIVWLEPEGGGAVPSDDFVFVRIAVGTRRGVLAVPRAAVMVRGGRTMVVRARKDAGGQVDYAPTPVELGAASGGDAEILSGLSAGDEVVARGGIGLLDPGFKAEGGD